MSFENRALHALRRFYDPQAFAVIPQLPDGTGLKKSRCADAIVVGLWKSRGMDLHLIEMKCSRSDLRKELKDPAKMGAFEAHVNKASILTTPGLCKPEELPDAWGLLELVSDEEPLRQVRPAKMFNERPQFTLDFVCGLARAVSRDVWGAKQIEEAKRIARHEGRLQGRKEAYPNDERFEKALNDLVAKVRAFEEASGLSVVSGWRGAKFNAAVVRLAEQLQVNSEGLLEPLRKCIADYDAFAERFRLEGTP